MKGEIVPESAVRFVRNFDAPRRARSALFPKNAALYGVEITKLKA
jgi:hypothetical protein